VQEVEPDLDLLFVESKEVATREVTLDDMRRLLADKPALPGAAFAGLELGMPGHLAVQVPAVAGWLDGKDVPALGLLKLHLSRGRFTGIEITLQGDVPALIAQLWPPGVRRLDGRDLSGTLWYRDGRRAVLDNGWDDDDSTWRLRFSAYEGTRLEDVLRVDRLPFGFETTPILGSSLQQLRDAYGAKLFEYKGGGALLILPPPLFSNEFSLDVGVRFDAKDRANLMCLGFDYGVITTDWKRSNEISKLLVKKFGKLDAPCSEGGLVKTKGLMIGAEHCVPAVQLTIGTNVNVLPPPPGCATEDS
jgi:hypothetical protein